MVLIGAGLPNAGALTPVRAGHIPELTPAMVLVPWYETEPMGCRLQEHVEVLAVGKESVITGEENVPCEERGKFLNIQEFGQAAGKLGVVRLSDEASELDDPLQLFRRGLGFEVV